jgi:hypothetical protein
MTQQGRKAGLSVGRAKSKQFMFVKKMEFFEVRVDPLKFEALEVKE